MAIAIARDLRVAAFRIVGFLAGIVAATSCIHWTVASDASYHHAYSQMTTALTAFTGCARGLIMTTPVAKKHINDVKKSADCFVKPFGGLTII